MYSDDSSSHVHQFTYSSVNGGTKCLSVLRLPPHYFQAVMCKSHDIHSVLYVSHDDHPLLGIHIRATYAIISLQTSLQNKYHFNATRKTMTATRMSHML